MKFIGKIVHVSEITGRGIAIITDREAGVGHTQLFPAGTELELRNHAGHTQHVRIHSAELALFQHKDYLAFLLKRECIKETIASFQQIWCDIHVELPGELDSINDDNVPL